MLNVPSFSHYRNGRHHCDRPPLGEGGVEEGPGSEGGGPLPAVGYGHPQAGIGAEADRVADTQHSNTQIEVSIVLWCFLLCVCVWGGGGGGGWGYMCVHVRTCWPLLPSFSHTYLHACLTWDRYTSFG